MLAQLHIAKENVGSRQFFYGKGCPTCSQSGYKGRLGIYEWLRMSEALRDMVTRKAPTLELKQKAIEQGMRTIREDGLRSILDGHTTLEEVIKYT
jgi:type IV pilus assembly protein PilB